MTRSSRLAPLALLALSGVVMACPRSEPPPPPAPVVNQDSIDAAARERARQDSIAAAERARQEEVARREQMRRDSIAAAERRMAELRNALTAPIYFDFDQATLTADARATLDAKLRILQANPNVRLRVAGHTDERGSDEYNLALGQRRAAAAKRYLTDRGIAGARIDVVSFGEERPVAQGSFESAWAQNRRDEFEVLAGGEMLTAPGGR